MGKLGHKDHFKLERRGNRINESKQSSEVERRHWAWREMLGKMAGIWEGADVQLERKCVNAGQPKGYPKTLVFKQLPFLPSCEVTSSCWHVWVLTRIPHHWVTGMSPRSPPTEMWIPFIDQRCSKNSEPGPLTRWPWAWHLAQASSDRLSQLTEESFLFFNLPRTTGKFIILLMREAIKEKVCSDSERVKSTLVSPEWCLFKV